MSKIILLRYVPKIKVGITSHFLWAEWLMGSVKELKSRIITRTAILSTMVRTTKEDRGARLFRYTQ